MFKVVEGSRGLAPHFSITCGLREGYGPDGKLHTVEEVVTIVKKYFVKCAIAGLPFLAGSITTGTGVYANLMRGVFCNEPQATFSGNFNPLYHDGLTTEEVAESLNGLASALGEALGQTRVYVAYDGDMWILQKEDSVTPKGERV